MEFATKYALVPEEQFSRHVPSKKQMTEFDVAMSNILNSSLSDHEKVRQYHELLQRKMNLQEFNLPWMSKQLENNKSEKEKSEKENSEKAKPEKEELDIKQEAPTELKDYDSFVISNVPMHMQKQAEALMNLLKSRSNAFEWDNSGVVRYKGQKIEKSNLADLFHLIFCVNKKPPVEAPTEFLNALQEMGVPESMIKNRFLSFQTKKIISPRRNFVKQKKRPTVKTPQMKPNVQSWESL